MASNHPAPPATASTRQIPAPATSSLFAGGQSASTNQQKQVSSQQDDNDDGGGQPQQCQLGSPQFLRDQKLSDIIIRYGAQGERVFHAHKAVLASASLWFHTAFLNPHFIEAKARKITLQNDDADALNELLRICYVPHDNYQYEHMPPWSAERLAAAKNTNRVLLFYLSVYTIADKYQAPAIRAHVLAFVNATLHAALNPIVNLQPTPQVIARVDLREIIATVYEMTAYANLRNPLRMMLLDCLMKNAATSPLGKRGTLSQEMRKAVVENAEFARDLFLRTVDAPMTTWNSSMFLGIVQQETCQRCGRMWVVSIDYAQPKCIFCGK